MVKKDDKINKIVKGVKEFKKKSKISKVIIFGSIAKGKMTKNSDVDVILVSKRFSKKNFFNRPIGLRKFWTLDYPVDFLCYTPEEFEKEKKRVSIVREALREGIEV